MAAWWRTSPQLRVREALLSAIAGLALAVVAFWPLAARLGRDVPLDLGDPLPQSWQVAWGGHALVHQPLSLFQSNQFWPLRDTLAFSDALLGYAPAGLIGDGPVAAVARYDVLWLLSFALAFAGARLLARELGAGHGAATVAGLAFAMAPWRLEQGGHLHVLSSGGIPLTLLLLLRGWRRERPALVLAGFAVAAWQVSLGFTLGLQLVYVLSALALVALAWWWRAGRPNPPRRMIAATAVGALALALASGLLARPYLRVLDEHPEAARSPLTVAHYSGGPLALLAAPETSLVWGGASAGVRARLDAVPEQTLFPGAAILLLAVVGLGWRGWPRGLRLGLGAAALVTVLLSLGFETSGAGRLLPYRMLYELAPGWQGVRVPGRLHTLTTLALALLAAGGAQRVAQALARRPGGAPWPPCAALAGLALVVALEGAGFGIGRGGETLAAYPHPTVPRAPAGLAGLADPLLELPARPPDNRRYLLWSTDGFPRLMNGRSSVEPRLLAQTLAAVEGFPDRGSVALLRRIGVRTVVLHADRAAGTPWAAWPARSPAGSGVRRERRGPLVVYRLGD